MDLFAGVQSVPQATGSDFTYSKNILFRGLGRGLFEVDTEISSTAQTAAAAGGDMDGDGEYGAG